MKTKTIQKTREVEKIKDKARNKAKDKTKAKQRRRKTRQDEVKTRPLQVVRCGGDSDADCSVKNHARR